APKMAAFSSSVSTSTEGRSSILMRSIGLTFHERCTTCAARLRRPRRPIAEALVPAIKAYVREAQVCQKSDRPARNAGRRSLLQRGLAGWWRLLGDLPEAYGSVGTGSDRNKQEGPALPTAVRSKGKAPNLSADAVHTTHFQAGPRVPEPQERVGR